MPVDVTATTMIDRPREEVAAYLRDPANDTSWIGGLRSARLLTPAPVAVGSRVERFAPRGHARPLSYPIARSYRAELAQRPEGRGRPSRTRLRLRRSRVMERRTARPSSGAASA